jgi:hypothetical protein
MTDAERQIPDAVRRASLVLLACLLAPGLQARAGAQEVAGCPVFPADNVWNVRVDELPVHPRSDDFVEAIGADVGVHPDFGTVYEGAPIGIPFVTVPGSQPRVPVDFLYASESDPGPYPIPPDPPIEGGSGSDGDRHVLIVDRDACVLYELFDARPASGGARWSAGSGAVFDLGAHALRPDGWTSADAAGLPILPGLVRYEEVESGAIRHALRFTAPDTRSDHVWPARHDASDLAASRYPPMGQRFRLRADFDLSGFSPRVRVILRALQTYGMMLADNGSPWFLSGVPDPRWDDETLVTELRRVQGSDFEAVDVSSLVVDPGSGRTAPPPPPDGGEWLTTPEIPGFRFRVRIVSPTGGEGGAEPPVRAEPCIPETLCVSGALPGRSELFVRIVGPKPNGRLWPTLVRFSTSRIEIWIEQLATGIVRHYVLDGATPGSDALPGRFDRDGFPPG